MTPSHGRVIVAHVPRDRAAYPSAPPLEAEFAWIADPDRRCAAGPRLRGIGDDSGAREFTLRYAAALDRLALREPSPETEDAAEAAAHGLWIRDGWDENWEDRPVREYVRWAFGRWLEVTDGRSS